MNQLMKSERRLCSGRGAHDTRIDSDERYDSLSFDELVEMARNPQPSVPKNEAIWFIPSAYRDQDARSFNAQRTFGMFYALPGDVDESDMSKEDLAALIAAAVGGPCRTLIYSSRSATPALRKWRFVVQLADMIGGAGYRHTQGALFQLLEEHSKGTLLLDWSLEREAQLIYAPNRGEFYEYLFIDAPPLTIEADSDLGNQSAYRKKVEDEAAAIAATRREQSKDAAGGVVGHFNERANLAVFFDHLGYTPSRSGIDWRSPYQTSKGFATRDYGDHWVSLSGSDANAGLGIVSASGARTGDAFDLYVHYIHGGNYSKAVRTYAEQAGIEKSIQLPEVPPGELFDDWEEVDEANLPSRDILYGNHYIRQFASLTVAPGGLGKSTLVLAECIAMATGRPILGYHPKRQYKVAYFNAEDPKVEITRRVLAMCRLHNIPQSALKGQLFISSGRDRPLVLSKGAEGKIVEPVFAYITDNARRRGVDVIAFDPLANLTESPETNDVFRYLVKRLSVLADELNISIELVHHTRKLYGNDATVEDSRGGSALVAGVRASRALNAMTKQEAKDAGLLTHIHHFRVEPEGKNNLTANAERADWYEKVGIPLKNGDGVAALREWKWPNPNKDLPSDTLSQVQERIKARGDNPPKADVQSSDWVGLIVADVLDLDIRGEGNEGSLHRVKLLVKGWLSSGALTKKDVRDKAKGRDVPCVFSGVEIPTSPPIPTPP